MSGGKLVRSLTPHFERPLPDLPRVAALRLRAGLAAVLRGEGDLDAFLAAEGDIGHHAARAHGIAALIGRRRTGFEQDVQAARFLSLRGGAFTVRVVRAVEAAGVPCVVLKGLPVAVLAWDDPSLRVQSDVDLLVPEDRLGEAEAALVTAGLSRPRTSENLYSHHDHLDPARPGGLLVELHRTLALDGPFGHDLAAVFERRIRVATPDGEVPALAHEDAVVQLALHAASHGVERLSWLVDLAGYARRQHIDWQLAARRARGWGTAPTVLAVWEEAIRTTGAPIPHGALEGLGVPGVQAQVVRRVLRASMGAGGRGGWALARAFRLAATPGPLAAARLVMWKRRMRAEG